MSDILTLSMIDVLNLQKNGCSDKADENFNLMNILKSFSNHLNDLSLKFLRFKTI